MAGFAWTGLAAREALLGLRPSGRMHHVDCARRLRPLLAAGCLAGGLGLAAAAGPQPALSAAAGPRSAPPVASGSRSAASAAGCASPVAQRQVAAATRVAVARYALERDGLAVHVALGQIAADRVLTDALRAGNLPAARAEAIRQVVHGRKHVTAIRVVRGSRVLVETGAYPFDVAGAQAPLHDRHGAVLGTLQVTIQDVIGFIRLVHTYGASQVVVRGSRGEAKTSLPAALAVRLPATGCATVAGRDYAVRSFGEAGFAGESLTIWILTRP